MNVFNQYNNPDTSIQHLPEASSNHSLFSDILLPYLNGDTERSASADRGGGLRGVGVLERGVGVLDSPGQN